MLMQLNSKRRKIASSLLSIFMGGWFLLLCQTCLALTETEEVNHESSIDMSDSCHELDEDSQTGISNFDDEHCLGVCDCDALTVTVQSEKNSELKENIKFKADVIAIVSPKASLSNRAPPGYLYSSSPERAKKPPFYTYNVLLI